MHTNCITQFICSITRDSATSPSLYRKKYSRRLSGTSSGLHDRRMVGNSGGGASRRPSIDASTRCIRRFKPRPSQNHSINLYVTSCKFSDYNGEELLGSWSSGEIGLFDIHDTTPDELTEISWGKSTQEKISGSPQNFNVQTNRLPTPKEIQDHIRSGNFERALECLEAYFDPLRRPNSDQVENDIEKIWYLSLSAALRLHRVYERVGWSFDSLENLSTEEESSTSEELIGKAESVAPNTWRGMWCLAIGLFLSSGGPGQATCEHRRSWLIKARYYAYLAYMTFQENEAANGPSDYETVPSVGAESVNNKLMMMKEFLSEVEKAVEQDTNTESSHDENEITERELETRALPSSLRWKWIDKMYLPKFDTAGEFAGPASGSVSTSNNILQYRDSDSNDNDISQDEYGTEDDVLMVGPDFNSSDEERLEHLTFAATHDSRFDSAENSEREDSLSERENDPITFNDIIALNNPGDDLRHPRREFFSSIMSEEEDEEENDGDDEEFELSIDPSRPRFSEIIYHFSRRNRSYLENNTPILGSEKIYNGHCNIMTTKEVNFFGPKDEYIVSGSDDGFLFVWDKNTTEIVQILQGDQDTVNVIQGHPFLPHMAVSGIDNTIKIFTPTSGPFTTSARKEPRLKTSYSPSSRMFEKDAIVERNIETHLSEPLIVEDNLYMDAENFLHDDPSLAVFLAEVSRI